MGGIYGGYGGRTNMYVVYRVLVRKSEGKRLLGRTKRSLEDTEIGSKGIGWKELD
jgi:hypothetical protein